MFCNKCGAKLSDDAKFCTKCGETTEVKKTNKGINNKSTKANKETKNTENANKATSNQDTKAKTKKSNTKLILLIVIPIILVILLMIGIGIIVSMLSVGGSIFLKNAAKSEVAMEVADTIKNEIDKGIGELENNISSQNIIDTTGGIVNNIINNINSDTNTIGGNTTNNSAISNQEVKEKFKKYFYDNYKSVYKVLLVDITNDGQDDMIVIEDDTKGGYTLKVFNYTGTYVKKIYENKGTKYHSSGFIDMYLYSANGKNYFLNGTDSMWQGYGTMQYEIFRLNNSGTKINYKTDKVQGSPVKDSEYTAFLKRYSNYAEKSIELIVTNGPKGIDKSSEYTDKKVFASSSTTTQIVAKEHKVGNSIIKFGKYKGDFDATGWNATITINADGTAKYVGHMQYNGKKSVNVTGTWTTKANAINMGGPNNTVKSDSITFKWSNGNTEVFAIGTKMFGDQWHSFNWVSE